MARTLLRHPFLVDRNRLLLLLGAAALALVVVAVVVSFGSGGGSDSSASTAATTSATTSPATLFAGLPQRGDTVGKASAPASLLVYEDPKCPYCREWDLDTLPTVVRDYVRTGRIRLTYRGIAILGGNSVIGLRANYGAAPQSKLWNMVVAMYERQGDERTNWITVPVITDAAKAIGANPEQLLKDADSKAVTAMIEASQAEAASRGINQTPSFVVERPLTQPVELNVTGLDPDSFTATLDQALR